MKTQGDSFMVAFRSADAALAWCLDTQKALLFADWPPVILQLNSCVTVAMPAEINTDLLYVFRGLRVRMGVHTGFPQAEYNPRTNGVDYFGPMV